MDATNISSDSYPSDTKQPIPLITKPEATSPIIHQKHEYPLDAQRQEPEDDFPRDHGPPFLKRLILVVCTLFLFWAALQLRGIFYREEKAQVIYASRYSKDHKFRPAASPIITETLKDGRIRIHGAGPTPDPVPLPTPAAKRRVGKGGAGRVRKQKAERGQ
ncbi:hypothetical protein H0H81_005181 [Sphagnurus paluster]|uniref:Uncharacterized protein n=1 Tax=Sphagnurus paluster TaxID=117069 RepID=A0A9P7GN99_9AGAR|nr:hypothetical protein H0H81_005181 [Sphagnurus paluster]